jgi:hypothetical protein
MAEKTYQTYLVVRYSVSLLFDIFYWLLDNYLSIYLYAITSIVLRIITSGEKCANSNSNIFCSVRYSVMYFDTWFRISVIFSFGLLGILLLNITFILL